MVFITDIGLYDDSSDVLPDLKTETTQAILNSYPVISTVKNILQIYYLTKVQKSIPPIQCYFSYLG